MNKIKVFCDYDGVLMDLDRAACKAHKVKYSDMDHHRLNGEWNITRPLGLAKNGEPMTEGEFWRVLQYQGVSFWTGIPKLPWFGDLVELLEEFDNWKVLTDPSGKCAAVSGKIESLKRNFGLEFNQFHLTSFKEDLASPNALLIDDNDDNVKKFREAGGRAIVFPNRGSSTWKHLDDPVGYVRQELERMKCI